MFNCCEGAYKHCLSLLCTVWDWDCASATTMNYLWSLLYGSNFIGEIKGFIAILRNGGTAISPILFSFFLHQLNIDQGYIFLISGALIILLSIAPFILRIFDQRIQPKRDKAL